MPVALQRALRLAEQGRDVLFVLDSLIALARAFRDEAEQQDRAGANAIASCGLKHCLEKRETSTLQAA